MTRLLECFVFSEIYKTVALSDESIIVSHFRDKDQVEVDLVLERSGGTVAGIEIKASTKVDPRDYQLFEAVKINSRRSTCLRYCFARWKSNSASRTWHVRNAHTYALESVGATSHILMEAKQTLENQ